MSTRNEHSNTREPTLSLRPAAYGPSSGEWLEPEKEPRDWKKLFLVLGLGALSWVATYVGMLELIESNMGDLPLVQQVIIGFAVAMLMTMIIWLLDQIFSPIPLTQKFVYVFGYLFLTLISVGFGFGFYWKVLESRGEATRSAEAAVGQVQTALHAGSTRLEQLSDTLEQLTTVSARKAIEEREKGTSCPNSSPGDGPRRKLRDADAQQFSFASDFVKSRVDQIRTKMAGLDAELVKIGDDSKSTIDPDTGTRNEFMRALNRRLDLTVTGFNAFRGDPQLLQLRGQLAERSERSIFPDGNGGTFACPDPQLQTALRGVVRAIDQLPVMQKPQIAAVEGAEATIEAFRRLSATLQGALVFELPPSADELRALQKKAVQSVSAGAPASVAAAQANQPVGLSKRDYIPLAIAIFVDFCLLLVSIGRPMNRLNSLVPVMREAERGPMIKILSRFNDIHRDPEIRQNFEVFRHVVFDMHGAYYVAVPLDAPYRPSGRGAQGGFGYGSHDAQELQHEAHLLANLFSGFEQQRIFSRVYNPFLTTKAIQKKLWRQGSKFAGCQAFRVYRFRDGAWSNMILQAVMGAAKRAEEIKRLRGEDETTVRTSQPEQPVEQPSTQPSATPAGRDGLADQAPMNGFDSTLRHAPDISQPGRRAERTADSYQVYGARSEAGGRPARGEAPPSRRRRRAAAANGANGAPKNRERASSNGVDRKANGEAMPHDEATLRQAFGRYATRAAVEFSASDNADTDDAFEAADELFANDLAGDDFVAPPANGNTAPSRAAGLERKYGEPRPARDNAKPEREDEVVIALSDRRPERTAFGSDGNVPAARSTLRPAAPLNEPAPLRHAEPAEKTGAPEPVASEVRTQVTLTRETATFEVPAFNAGGNFFGNGGMTPVITSSTAPALQPQFNGEVAALEAPVEPVAEAEAIVSDDAARQAVPEAEVAEVAAVVPPPLPDWALKGAEDSAETNAPVDAASEDADGMIVEAGNGTVDKHSLTEIADHRWEITQDPFADDVSFDEEDETIVTIARRLRPQAGPAE